MLAYMSCLIMFNFFFRHLCSIRPSIIPNLVQIEKIINLCKKAKILLLLNVYSAIANDLRRHKLGIPMYVSSVLRIYLQSIKKKTRGYPNHVEFSSV